MQTKSDEEKKAIINRATREGRKDRQKDKVRQRTLRNKINEKLERSRKILEAREENNRGAKEKMVESVLEFRIWKNADDVNNGVKKLSKTRAINALKMQIRFRTDMLLCSPPNKIAFTKASQKDFEAHLIELTQVEIPEETVYIYNVINDPDSLVGCSFNQKWVTDGRDNFCRGAITGIVKTSGKDTEYKCQFEEEIAYQTVAELVADLVVGDLFLYFE